MRISNRNKGLVQLQDVLQLVLLHAPDLSMPRDLCSLLQVSTPCRRAVQQSRAHCSINMTYMRSLEQLTALSTFAAWLPQHSGLVSELNLSMASDSGFHQVAGQLVKSALQVCALAAATAAPAASTAVLLPAQLQDARPPPLHLTKLCTDDLVQTPGLLDVLAAFQLQELVLSITPCLLQPSSCAALAKLQCLRALSVTSRGAAVDSWPEAWVVAVGQLQQLTYLYMTQMDPALSGLLPGSLQELDMCDPFLQLEGDQDTTSWDVSHLTALTKLTCSCADVAVRVYLKLPQHSLPLLNVAGNLQLVEPWHIQALTVNAYDTSDLQQLLPQLAAQPHPTSLEVMLWKDLGASHAEWVRAAAALGMLTGLTRLSWVDVSQQGGMQDGMPLFTELLRLTNLSSLCLEVHRVRASDVMQLSKLASLTDLMLCCRYGLTDMAAVALACGLRGLQELSLDCSDLQTWACLPVIAQLTQLKSLELWCFRTRPNLTAAFGPEALQQLSSLTGLTSLSVPLESCPEDCQQQFLANMPLLQCITDSCS